MKIPYITVTVDEPGPNARAMLESRKDGRCIVEGCRYERGHWGACRSANGSRLYMRELESAQPCSRCTACAKCDAHDSVSPRPTVARVLEIVRNVIRARRQACYGELRICDDQLEELARAIVTNIAAEIATGDL